MKPYLYNVLNASVLIILGIWGYVASESPSPTALIPVFSGIILLLLSKWMKDGNKAVAHIVVVLTFLLLVAFIKPLTGSISRGNEIGVIRVLIMMISCAVATVVYIKSFVDARIKNKNS
jgi:hypothetical protein